MGMAARLGVKPGDLILESGWRDDADENRKKLSILFSYGGAKMMVISLMRWLIR
jgi:hypothetical protein